jgi:hypothetical protein
MELTSKNLAKTLSVRYPIEEIKHRDELQELSFVNIGKQPS